MYYETLLNVAKGTEKWNVIYDEFSSIEDIARLISETLDKAFAEEIRPEKFLETAKMIRKEFKQIIRWSIRIKSII